MRSQLPLGVGEKLAESGGDILLSERAEIAYGKEANTGIDRRRAGRGEHLLNVNAHSRN